MNDLDVVLGVSLLGVFIVLVLPAVYHALRHDSEPSPSDRHCDHDCSDCEDRDVCTEQEFTDEDAEDENRGDCGAFGEELYQPGTEACETCPVSAPCQRIYQQWLKDTAGGTRPGGRQ